MKTRPANPTALLAACALLIGAAVSPLNAAIVFLKGSDDAMHVRTLREDATSLVVGVPQPDGTFVERLIEKRDVDQLIRTVSADRLARLKPEEPAAYRDYAEELAEKRVDPDARAAAIQLYLIAAYLAPQRLGRSSLLGMTSLARSPAEERKFRAMVYLLDPKHDRSVLAEKLSGPAEATDESEGRTGLMAALRLLRQGNNRVAARMAQRPSVLAALDAHGRTLSRAEFLAACAASERLSPATLARVIRLELELSGAKLSEGGSDTDKNAAWAAAIASGQTAPVPSLKLETLTEFDPRQSIYRDGKWVAAE